MLAFTILTSYVSQGCPDKHPAEGCYDPVMIPFVNVGLLFPEFKAMTINDFMGSDEFDAWYQDLPIAPTNSE